VSVCMNACYTHINYVFLGVFSPEHVVHLTWMAYDMVVRRTSPEQGYMLNRLEDAYQQCRAVVCGQEGGTESNPEPEEDMCAEPVEKPSATTPPSS